MIILSKQAGGTGVRLGIFLWLIEAAKSGGPDFHPISRHTWSIASDGWALYLPVTCRPDEKKIAIFLIVSIFSLTKRKLLNYFSYLKIM